jgi:uncharacterized protein (TIGR00295 family)
MTEKTKTYPTRDECLEILKKHNCPEHVIEHLLAVTELAIKIAERISGANRELVQTGAMLHDIGRSKTHDINHALEGSKIVRDLGFGDEVVNIVESHIVAGILPDDAVSLGLPRKDYTPQTLEARIVAHADNLFEGSRRVNIERTIEHLEHKKLFKVAQRVKELHIQLSKEAGIDIDKIK